MFCYIIQKKLQVIAFKRLIFKFALYIRQNSIVLLDKFVSNFEAEILRAINHWRFFCLSGVSQLDRVEIWFLIIVMAWGGLIDCICLGLYCNTSSSPSSSPSLGCVFWSFLGERRRYMKSRVCLIAVLQLHWVNI